MVSIFLRKIKGTGVITPLTWEDAACSAVAEAKTGKASDLDTEHKDAKVANSSGCEDVAMMLT